MFRKELEIYKPVADRIEKKIKEKKLHIEMEMGATKEDDQVVVHFRYKDYITLSKVIDEAINEEIN